MKYMNDQCIPRRYSLLCVPYSLQECRLKETLLEFITAPTSQLKTPTALLRLCFYSLGALGWVTVFNIAISRNSLWLSAMALILAVMLSATVLRDGLMLLRS